MGFLCFLAGFYHVGFWNCLFVIFAASYVLGAGFYVLTFTRAQLMQQYKQSDIKNFKA